MLLILPPDLFDRLSREHTAFATFYAATHHARLSRAIGNLQQAASGSTVLGTLVRDLGVWDYCTRSFQTVPGDYTI